MVPVEATMLAGPTWMTAPDAVTTPGAVTAHRSRLAGRERQHDGQCRERHEEQRVRTSQRFHAHASLSRPYMLRRLPLTADSPEVRRERDEKTIGHPLREGYI